MADNLKILHVLDHSLPHQDGYSSRSFQIMAAQKRKSWEPIAVTSPKHEIDCGDFGPIVETIESIVYHRSGGIGHSQFGLYELRLMKQLFGRMRHIVRSFQPDVIHAHSPVLNVIPAIVCGKLFGIPVVYEIRAFWEDAGVDQGTYKAGSPKYRMVRNIETLCCRMANHVTVICGGLKNELVSRGLPESKISIIYNAIHPDDFAKVQPDPEYVRQWRIPDRAKVVGFIGSFYDFEGLDVLIRAFGEVAAVRSETILVLVGGGEKAEALRRLVESRGLSERVRLPGRIPLRRVPGAYALMDLMVYPRKAVRLTELVTPLKPLEAMAMGKALIATDIGGHRELIIDGETGMLVPPDDAPALAKGIIYLLSNHELRSVYGTRGAQRVRNHFTWEVTTAHYAGIYAGILGVRAAAYGLLRHKETGGGRGCNH